MKTLFTKVTMYREGDSPIFGESCTDICIDDEGGGMFIVLRQHPDKGDQELRFDTDELDDLIKNILYMRDMIEQYEEGEKND